MIAGGCHCGAIRYRFATEPSIVSVCHCRDCQRSAGAPLVAWADFADTDLQLTRGTPKQVNTSGATTRAFCPDCGSGLFYWNPQFLPGIVAVQSASLDDPDAWAPTAQVQVAERQSWVSALATLEAHERYPGSP
jgi:hypothetical protein